MLFNVCGSPFPVKFSLTSARTESILPLLGPCTTASTTTQTAYRGYLLPAFHCDGRKRAAHRGLWPLRDAPRARGHVCGVYPATGPLDLARNHASMLFQSGVKPPHSKVRYFTVKLIEDNTVPASSVTSTLQLPGLTDLLLQVWVEVNLMSRAYAKTFLSPRYHTHFAILFRSVWRKMMRAALSFAVAVCSLTSISVSSLRTRICNPFPISISTVLPIKSS